MRCFVQLALQAEVGTAGMVLTEPHRQALRYIIRNTALPQSMRNKAQLELAQMHSYTRPTQIKNRCVMGGVARGVFRAFRMGRVSDLAKQSVCQALHDASGTCAAGALQSQEDERILM